MLFATIRIVPLGCINSAVPVYIPETKEQRLIGKIKKRVNSEKGKKAMSKITSTVYMMGLSFIDFISLVSTYDDETIDWAANTDEILLQMNGLGRNIKGLTRYDLICNLILDRKNP